MQVKLNNCFFSLEVFRNLVNLREKPEEHSLRMGIIEMSNLNYTELG